MNHIIFTIIFTIIIGFSNHLLADRDISHPKIKWRFKAQGPIRGSSVIFQEKIIFGSSDGFIYALKKNDGTLIWKYPTNGAVTCTPAVSESSVYVSSRDNFIYSINAQTGALHWKFEMLPILPASFDSWDYFSSSPVITKNQILVGSGDGHLYALDSKTGNLLWKFKTSERIRATALVEKDIVYQPSNDGFVYALDVNTGKPLWEFETKGAKLNSQEFGFDRNSIYTQPQIHKNILVFGSRDGNTYAVDLKTKKEKWNFTYGSTWSMANSISDNVVYVGWSTNNLISAIDLNTGLEKWKFKSDAHNYTVPLVLDSGVYIGSADGKIYRLNKDSGEKNWEYTIDNEVYSSLTYDDHTLFFGSDNGFFYALEEGQKPYKAVYLPSNITGNLIYLIVDQKISPYLKEKGFEQLDSAGLYQFIDDRIRDQRPSVVVFSYPIIPKNIIGEQPEKGMIRTYLESGGKIIWMGDIPNYFEPDGNGNFNRNPLTGMHLLGVKFNYLNESGNFYSKTTQEGMNWGLNSWLRTTSSTVEPDGVIPFAHDEYGRISLWMKKFNPRPGSGFISCRTWSWNVRIQEDDLKLIYNLAVHELE